MTRVTRPLYGDRATGNIGTVGTFRMGRYGPEFIKLAKGGGGNTSGQRRNRDCFKAARAAHSAITPTPWVDGNRSGVHRVPSWPEFWLQWLIDHPECTP